ncbi:MAG: translesion DNA synthesis-associated protein ImuA [Pseudomonadota bacterium]
MASRSTRPSPPGAGRDTKKTPEANAGVFFSPDDAEAGLADTDNGGSAPGLNGLSPLFERAELWRGTNLQVSGGATCATGYPQLDAVLPGGGWPVTSLTELMSGTPGVGELRLLMPALAALAARQPGWVVWIAPPYLPNAPALQQWGLPPERVLLIHPRSAADAAWAAEQALASGTCIAVLLWTDTLESGRAFAPARRRDPAALSMQQFSRRLQLAAAAHQCWAVLLRAATARRQPSAAALRLFIEVASGQRNLHVVKVRGGKPTVIPAFDDGVDVGAAMLHEALGATDDNGVA